MRAATIESILSASLLYRPITHGPGKEMKRVAKITRSVLPPADLDELLDILHLLRHVGGVCNYEEE